MRQSSEEPVVVVETLKSVRELCAGGLTSPHWVQPEGIQGRIELLG